MRRERKEIHLHLIGTGDYQEALKADGIKAAQAFERSLKVFSADGDEGLQKTKLFDSIWGRNGVSKADAIVVSVAGKGWFMGKVAEEAAKADVAVVTLNTLLDNVPQLRKLYPDLPLGYVGPDQRQAGRLQGQQILRLARGGDLLYVTGPNDAWAVNERRAGTMEIIGNMLGGFKYTERQGNWRPDSIEKVVYDWIGWMKERPKAEILIACQSDPMAIGAAEALEKRSREVGFEQHELRKVPVLGIDGLELGRRRVDSSDFRATVTMNPCSREALEFLIGIERGNPIQDHFLTPESYPPIINIR